MKARLNGNKVIEILTPISGFAIEDCFHPLILVNCCDVADDVQVGWVRQEDGSFAAPVVEEVVAPTEPVPE